MGTPLALGVDDGLAIGKPADEEEVEGGTWVGQFPAVLSGPLYPKLSTCF